MKTIFKTLDKELKRINRKWLLSFKNTDYKIYRDSTNAIDNTYNSETLLENELLIRRKIKLITSIDSFKLVIIPIVISLIFGILVTVGTNTYQLFSDLIDDFKEKSTGIYEQGKNLLTDIKLTEFDQVYHQIYDDTMKKLLLYCLVMLILALVLCFSLELTIVNIYSHRVHKIMIKEYEINKIEGLLMQNKENVDEKDDSKDNTKGDTKDEIIYQQKEEMLENKTVSKVLVDESSYPSASIALDICKDEYTKERERSNIIDNKLGIFISAILAIITIYIPIIPFDEFAEIFAVNDKAQIILSTIFISILVLSAISLIMAFVYMISAISLKPFNRVNYSSLQNENNLMADPDKLEKGLVEHYNIILDKNTKINDRKAEKFTKGLKSTILFFVLLMIGTIGLLIIK